MYTKKIASVLLVVVSSFTLNAQTQNTLPPTGNVGIGTINPNTKLEVDGSVLIDSSLTVTDSVNVKGKLSIGQAPDNISQTIIKAANNKIGLTVIGNNADDNYGVKVVANNNLHKAIAITEQENNGVDVFKVMGDGTVWATEVNVQLTPFPDYVFNKNYDLSPLEDVEKFINKHHHLPNLPSANEVEKNNIGLGELNRKMLEKIEELTLYVIALKKENKKLNTKINQLTK